MEECAAFSYTGYPPLHLVSLGIMADVLSYCLREDRLCHCPEWRETWKSGGYLLCVTEVSFKAV